MAPDEAEPVFGDYFAIFPWEQFPLNAEGFDMGCGSGRWDCFVAPRVGRLHCIDPSSALAAACRSASSSSSPMSLLSLFIGPFPSWHFWQKESACPSPLSP